MYSRIAGNTTTALVALVSALSVSAPSARAQSGVATGGDSMCHVAGGTGPAPSAAVYRLTPPCLRDLRAALAAGEFGRALEIYFGDSYNAALANWVVYVRADGSVKQGVIQHNRVTELLRGQKYVYTSAFFEAVPSNPTDSITPALELSRRSINFAKEPLTTALVGAFGGGKVPSFDNGATVADLDRQVTLRQVSDDRTTPLWAGSARVEIGENTDVQLSLAPNGRQRLPGSLSRLYTTLNNAKATRFDVGIGFATSLGPGAVTTVGTTQVVASSAKSNVYLTMNLNLLPARLPRFRRSWGLALGTNLLKGPLLDDLMTGVAVGRVLGDVGLISGIVWEQRKSERLVGGTTTVTEKRTPRFFIGFDLRS